jgi:hypothetical protein
MVPGLSLCKLRNAQNYSLGAGMLVGSYLGERVQFVRSAGQESSVGAVTCGVSQGSVLDPLLFISYIDEVSRVIRYCRFHILRMICRFITLVLCRTFKGVLMS